MFSPMDQKSEAVHLPEYMNVSPERLETLTPSELADAMEQALEHMTDETYDPQVIGAYLDALDRASPLPAHRSAEEALEELARTQQQLQYHEDPQPVSQKQGIRHRTLKRATLVAAILCACLFGATAAQASGVDILGLLARWTNSVLSLGELPNGLHSGAVDELNDPSEEGSLSAGARVVLPEYQEFWEVLQERDMTDVVFPTAVPEGFVVDEIDLYASNRSREVDFYIRYKNSEVPIHFRVMIANDISNAVYEKTAEMVDIYLHQNVKHYIFQNTNDITVNWCIGEAEYSLSTANTEHAPEILTEIIKSMYKGVTL